LPYGDKSSPREIAKADFAKHLYEEIHKRGWTQSEFARHCDLARDAISTYVRGRSLPSDDALLKMSAVLGVEAHDLLPTARPRAERAQKLTEYFIEMRELPHDDTRVVLHLHKILPKKVAERIFILAQSES
jgi:transcriptional regulator with XRE-family HTH domain